jgi:hypothetical protein
MHHTIKESLQVQIHDPVVAFPKELLRTVDGLVGRAVWAKTETETGKRTVPLGLEDLG